jgi:hypothetical protein
MMAKIDTTLGNIFNTPTLVKNNVTVINTACDTIQQTDVTPYDDTISNLKTMIKVSETALRSAQDTCESNEESKSFEAYAKVMQSIIELNRELVNTIRLREFYIKEKTSGAHDSPAITNNILAVGTTDDLQKLLLGMASKGSNNVTKN